MSRDPCLDHLEGFDTIQLTPDDLRYHYKHLPPLSRICLPERLLGFPRTVHEENFGHPRYLFERKQYQWKMRWACRAASRGWSRAIEHGDISHALPPRHRDPPPQGKERQVLLEESLCLAVADKALDLYFSREAELTTAIHGHASGALGCEIRAFSNCQIDDDFLCHFPNEPWISNTRGLATEVSTYALHTVYEVLYDSADSLDFPGPPFPMYFCQKWFPKKSEVPAERFMVIRVVEGTDEEDSEEDDEDVFRDIKGNPVHPDAEEMARIERWEDEWGSEPPPVRPKLPSLGEYLAAKAKWEANQAANPTSMVRTYAEAAGGTGRKSSTETLGADPRMEEEEETNGTVQLADHRGSETQAAKLEAKWQVVQPRRRQCRQSRSAVRRVQ